MEEIKVDMTYDKKGEEKKNRIDMYKFTSKLCFLLSYVEPTYRNCLQYFRRALAANCNEKENELRYFAAFI